MKQRTYVTTLAVLGVVALIIAPSLHDPFSPVAYLAGAILLLLALFLMFYSLALARRRTER